MLHVLRFLFNYFFEGSKSALISFFDWLSSISLQTVGKTNLFCLPRTKPNWYLCWIASNEEEAEPKLNYPDSIETRNNRNFPSSSLPLLFNLFLLSFLLVFYCNLKILLFLFFEHAFICSSQLLMLISLECNISFLKLQKWCFHFLPLIN